MIAMAERIHAQGRYYYDTNVPAKAPGYNQLFSDFAGDADSD